MPTVLREGPTNCAASALHTRPTRSRSRDFAPQPWRSISSVVISAKMNRSAELRQSVTVIPSAPLVECRRDRRADDRHAGYPKVTHHRARERRSTEIDPRETTVGDPARGVLGGLVATDVSASAGGSRNPPASVSTMSERAQWSAVRSRGTVMLGRRGALVRAGLDRLRETSCTQRRKWLRTRSPA
jgi:hypothetical protein